jgi:smad nuclear-interacting protein 1
MLEERSEQRRHNGRARIGEKRQDGERDRNNWRESRSQSEMHSEIGRDRNVRTTQLRRRSASPPPRSRQRSASPVSKGKPNFAPSGLLAAATKTVETSMGDSVLLKYHEPPEARKPKLGWRLYVFKGSEQVGEFTFARYCTIYLIQ